MLPAHPLCSHPGGAFLVVDLEAFRVVLRGGHGVLIPAAFGACAAGLDPNGKPWLHSVEAEVRRGAHRFGSLEPRAQRTARFVERLTGLSFWAPSPGLPRWDNVCRWIEAEAVCYEAVYAKGAALERELLPGIAGIIQDLNACCPWVPRFPPGQLHRPGQECAFFARHLLSCK